MLIENPYDPESKRVHGHIFDIVDNHSALVGAVADRNSVIFWAPLGSPFIGCEPDEDG